MEYAAVFAGVRKDLRSKMSVEATKEGFDFEDLKKIHSGFWEVAEEREDYIRDSELEILNTIIVILESGEENAGEIVGSSRRDRWKRFSITLITSTRWTRRWKTDGC